MTNSAADDAPSPVSLNSKGEFLEIEWSDNVRHRISWLHLRENCPCATCRAQPPEQPPRLPMLKPTETQPVQPTAMKPIGNYAYGIAFNDGHDTGIFSLELLRELGDLKHTDH